MSAQEFLLQTRYQDNPLSAVTDFLSQEERFEQAGAINHMRFVGYVLELGYDEATIITSDPYKRAVGGIPRGSFLIMAPGDFIGMPPHFTLLRVNSVAPTPLSGHVQQTYFELHKKSMPALDRFTQGELQWGALRCSVLGMFYPDAKNSLKIAFSGDVNNVVSAHRYRVYAPNETILNIVVNEIVKLEDRFKIGELRMTECQLPLSTEQIINLPVQISIGDFKGARTAMFGKTRLGKSNTVKLIVKGMLDSTFENNSIGQIIFDINGEYANDNPQDNNSSIWSAYQDRSEVYALTKRSGRESRPLRLNFYEQPESCIGVLASLLQQDNRSSIYIQSFASVVLPSIGDVLSLPIGERDRPIRKIQIYWAILKKAGFEENNKRLQALGLRGANAKGFNPHFSKSLREAAYKKINNSEAPSHPETLDQLVKELEIISEFSFTDPKDKALKSTGSGEPILDAHDIAMLRFLQPQSGSAGPSVLIPYAKLYHSPNASNFVEEILNMIDNGKTVILDLGSATDKIRRYFSDMLSSAVFMHQERKFVNNSLGNHYIQLYFEEAHNIFPRDAKDLTDVYSRFAKEGAKFHIGMVYSTQSPSTISQELLAQTENFFVGHLSSQDEARALTRVQVQYDGLQDDILKSKTPGYMRMLTRSHRFVIPVQVYRFE